MDTLQYPRRVLEMVVGVADIDQVDTCRWQFGGDILAQDRSDVSQFLVLGGFVDVVEELARDVDGEHPALFPHRPGKKTGVESRSSPDIGNRHPGTDCQRLHDLFTLVEHLAAFTLEPLDKFGDIRFAKLIVDTGLDAFFLGGKGSRDHGQGQHAKHKKHPRPFPLIQKHYSNPPPIDGQDCQRNKSVG